ncbi:MAG: hypothetical protein K2P94_05745 [Rhodospirillaceae bacterium]|nr:hypothetical protein [Rhodospirillaceae bacterium]
MQTATAPKEDAYRYCDRASGEHVYAQRYRTEESPKTIGFIDFVVDAGGIGQYVVRVQQGTKPFASLAEAEAWMQTRASGGAPLMKG